MMINRNKERILRDICLNHSARSDKDIGRACPTKLNKQELEDVYYTLVDDNFRLKNNVLALEQQVKGLTTKLQRMTNAQRSTIMKEKASCPMSKALVHEQREHIEELQLANHKLVEKIKLLNMQMCSAKQFINTSGSGTRCSKCFIRNSISMLNSSKRSENNLKALTSGQYIDKFKLKATQKLEIKSQKAMKKKTNKTDYYSDTSTEKEWPESGDSLDDLSEERENKYGEGEDVETSDLEKEKIKKDKETLKKERDENKAAKVAHQNKKSKESTKKDKLSDEDNPAPKRKMRRLRINSDCDEEVVTQKPKKGDYVIVRYEGEHFPGTVENTDGDLYEISTMNNKKKTKLFYGRQSIFGKKREVMTTRSLMTSVSVNTEQQEQKLQPNLSCKENKCAEQIEELNLKITELKQTLMESSEKHVDAISKLDHQGISLRQENVTLRTLNSTLEEKLLELNSKIRAMEVHQSELSSELVLEKRKVSELVTELKINSTSSMNIARAIEDHLIKMKTEESIKSHDEVRKQVERACVKSDVASKYSEDSGYIDHSRSGHSDIMLRKQNQELVRRIDDLQNQIDTLQNSKELTHHTQMTSPKRASEFSSNEISVVNTHFAEETLIERETTSSPKSALNRLAKHSSTESDSKQDTIKNTDVDNTHFSAFFVNIENASSPKDSRTAKDKPTNATNPILTNSNNTNEPNGTNIPTKVNGSNKDMISKKHSGLIKRDKRKDDSLKSDTEKRDRTRTLSTSSIDKRRHNKLNSENGTNVKKREQNDSVKSAKTYVVPGNVKTRSPENTDCEISSYSDLPSEKDEVCAVSVRSAGERAPLYSDSTILYTTSTAETRAGELSEGELPAFRTGRQLSLGEREMSDYRDLNNKISPTHDVESTLTAVSAELNRCRQLLRLSTANL